MQRFLLHLLGSRMTFSIWLDILSTAHPLPAHCPWTHIRAKRLSAATLKNCISALLGFTLLHILFMRLKKYVRACIHSSPGPWMFHLPTQTIKNTAALWSRIPPEVYIKITKAIYMSLIPIAYIFYIFLYDQMLLPLLLRGGTTPYIRCHHWLYLKMDDMTAPWCQAAVMLINSASSMLADGTWTELKKYFLSFL